MKKFSEVTIDTQNIAPTQAGTVSDMHQHGSTTAVGSPNGHTKSKDQISLTEHKKQQLGDICEQKTLTSEEKKKLTVLITSTYQALKTYGKTPEELEALIMFMQMTLIDKPYKDIRAAFMSHIRESPEVPTPSDILKRLPVPPTDNGLTEAQYKRLIELRQRDGL